MLIDGMVDSKASRFDMTTLKPIVRQRLFEFKRRRNQLLAIKGLSAAILLTISVGLVCAAIDARWALSLNTRWIIATSIYLAIAITIGILAIGPSLRGRSLAWLASMFEQAEPKMKDRLIAAIELSSEFMHPSANRPTPLYDRSTLDSADFRRAVQQSAARRIESIQVTDVLPWQLIKPWMLSSALILVGVALLCFVPNLHLASRLGRVLLPMANIGRVSKYSIEITKPSSAYQCIPEENVVAIQATIHGGIPSSVILETESLDGNDNKTQAMHNESDSTSQSLFQIHWSPPLGKTRYRVLAEDASTAWYQIDVRPFPKVEKFSIEYRYPEYTREPNRTFESDQGNLEALADTIASVSIFANQALSGGEFRVQVKDRSLETENSDTRIPIHRSHDGQWTAEVPIHRNATYRIDLVAADTKFTNTFSPKYTINAITDQPPSIRWTKPNESSFAVQANQLLDLAAVVSDEIPIVSLTQQMKSGSNDWRDRSIPVGELAEQGIDLLLDLGPLNVKPGDMVQTRLVATDRKGQSTTSTVLELVVSSMSLDPERQTKMRDRVELAKQVDAYHKKLEEQSKSTRVIREQWKKNPDDLTLQRQLTDSIAEFSVTARQESAQLQRKITELLPKMDDSVSATELELVAQSIARIETVNLNSLELSVPQSAEKPQDPKTIEQSTEQIDKITKTTSQIAKRTRDFVSHDVLSQVGQDLSVLLRHQQELRGSMGELLPEQYRRRQMLVARQMQDLSELLREQIPILQSRSERTARQWTDWLDTQVRKIHDVTGKEGKEPPAQETQSERDRLAKQIEEELQKHQNSGNIDSGSPQEQLQARKELREKVDSSSRTIEQLAKAVSQLDQPKHAENAEAEIARQLLPALEQLAVRRELQQARHDGDNQFVADLGEAYRAAQAIARDRHLDPKATRGKLEALEKSMKTLEAIHDLQQSSETLEQLHSTERWKSNSLDARFEQPRVWDAFRQQITQATHELAGAKAPRETIAGLQTLQKSELMQRADSKIGPRRWTSTSTASAAQELEELQGELRSQMATLTEVANEARQNLAAHTPKVADLARDAAEKTREGSEETKSLSKAVADGEVPDVAPRVEQLKQDLEKTEPALEQLREALADVASRQDLMKQSDAEIARDADASIAITNDLEKRISQSIEHVAEASNNDATRQQLDASASTQDQATKSLEQIASHFEAMNNAKATPTPPPSIANPTPSAIAEAAKEVAHQPEMDQAHAEAEQLRRLASLDPKQVLEQLEKELARNKPMRVELSNIAEDAVENALQTLEFTADREQEMSVGLENSDLDFSKQKERTLGDTLRVAKHAKSIAENLATRVQSMADQIPAREIRKDVQRMRDDLQRAVEAAEATDAKASMKKIVESAKGLETQLEYFRRGMARQAISLEEASEKQTAANENQRRERKRTMEDLQSRFREEDVRQAFAQERNRQQETQQADQERKKAERNVEQKKRDLDQAQRQVAKGDESDAKQRAVENHRAQLQFAEADLQWAQQQRVESEARQTAAKKAREQLQMNELKPLNAPDPVSQFSSRTAIAASLAAQEAVAELRASLGQAEKVEEPKAAAQALMDATTDQEGLQKGIEVAAEALARASRHEDRLANPDIHAVIEQQAAQVATIAHESMHRAKEWIEAAANEAKPASRNTPAQASGPTTRQSQQSLQSAEQALREQADSLRTATNREKNPNNTGNAATDATAATKKASGLLSPQEMAQMLDELDQQLNSSPEAARDQTDAAGAKKSAKSSSQKSGQPSKAGAPSEPSDPAADERAQTLADAAQRLAAEMNQQRQAMESSPKTMPETGAPDSQSRSATQPGKSSTGIVMPVDIENIEDWGKLRQQSAENALEGDREQILPAYRQQIEEYFRILSKRQPTK